MNDEDAPEEPLSPEFRQRLIAAVERSLRVRREIVLLAGHASGHLPGSGRACRNCHLHWPCADTFAAARSALDAFAEVSPDQGSVGELIAARIETECAENMPGCGTTQSYVANEAYRRAARIAREVSR